MLINRVILFLLFSSSLTAVTTPNDFIENFINEEDYGEIYKVDFLIIENQFIEEIDLKEKFATLEPFEFSKELFVIKDRPTLLVNEPVLNEKDQNNFIKIEIESSDEEIAKEETTTEEDKKRERKINLFERILFEKELTDITRKLKLSKDYRVLHSISWYQPLVEKDRSVSLYVESSIDQVKTYGEILIYKDRYLHFDSKLRLSEKTEKQLIEKTPLKIKIVDFNDSLKLKTTKEETDANDNYWMETIFNNIKINIGNFSDWVFQNDIDRDLLNINNNQPFEYEYKDLYEINQETKIEENKYHFIDHPYFGVIVRISSLQIK